MRISWNLQKHLLLTALLLSVKLTINAQPYSNTVHVNDQVQLQHALDLCKIEPVSNIIVDVARIDLDSTIILPGSMKTMSLAIRGNSCDFRCTDNFYARGDSTAFIRHPKNKKEAQSWMDNNIFFYDMNIYGGTKNKLGQVPKGSGIEYCAAFGGGITNCFIYNFNRGVTFRFILNGFQEKSQFNHCTNGSIDTCGDWEGANAPNSSCNGIVRQQCRAYNRVNGDIAFGNYFGSMCRDVSCISEGGITNYDFYYEGANTSREYTIDGAYIEKDDAIAAIGCKLKGGDIYINNIWQQHACVLIDAGTSVSGNIFLTHVCWSLPETKFKSATTNGVKWTMEDIYGSPESPSMWVDGKLPMYYSFMQHGTLKNHFYNPNSMRYNGESVDSILEKKPATKKAPKPVK